RGQPPRSLPASQRRANISAVVWTRAVRMWSVLCFVCACSNDGARSETTHSGHGAPDGSMGKRYTAPAGAFDADASAISLLRALPVDGTRLLTRRWKVGAEPLSNGEIFDSEKKVTCRPELAADGVVRCLPPESLIAFADAACTEPLLRIYDDPC